MAHSKQAYQAYIHSLLEPDEVLITGKQKRDVPGWMLKAKALREFGDQQEMTEAEKDRWNEGQIKKMGL